MSHYCTQYFCPLQGTERNTKKNLGKSFDKIVLAELLANSEVFTATTFSSVLTGLPCDSIKPMLQRPTHMIEDPDFDSIIKAVIRLEKLDDGDSVGL